MCLDENNEMVDKVNNLWQKTEWNVTGTRLGQVHHFLPIASWCNGRKWARPYVFSVKQGNVQTQASLN